MSGLREYNFITGITSASLPAASTPSAATDLVNKAYVDGTEVDFTIANNQSSAANVTGVSFLSASIRAVRALVFIHRQDATPTQADEFGELYIRYRAVQNDWQVSFISHGDDAGVEFSMTGTTTGQLQYTSTNYTGGSYSGTLTIKFTNRDQIEV